MMEAALGASCTGPGCSLALQGCCVICDGCIQLSRRPRPLPVEFTLAVRPEWQQDAVVGCDRGTRSTESPFECPADLRCKLEQ